jgi:hypothetical protein
VPVVEPVVPPTQSQLVRSQVWPAVQELQLNVPQALVPVLPVVEPVVPLVEPVVGALSHAWLAMLQVKPLAQQPSCGVEQTESGAQPSRHCGAPPSRLVSHHQACEPEFCAWHCASEVQPAGPGPQWPVLVSHWLPLLQSAAAVHGPQKPLTQPRPLQVSAVWQAVLATHWPCAQFSPVRHWLLWVQAPQWPGLPVMHTGSWVPWQSVLLLQPNTQVRAWQMKAFTQSSLREQPASGAGAPHVPASGRPRQAWAPEQSLRCVQVAPAPVEPLLPLLPPVVLTSPRQAPLVAQWVWAGQSNGRTPRQLPHLPLMQNEPELHAVSSVQPPASSEPVVPPEPALVPEVPRGTLEPPHAPAIAASKPTAPRSESQRMINLVRKGARNAQRSTARKRGKLPAARFLAKAHPVP